MASYYRNDLWTLNDEFGLGRVGDQVARMALEADPPFITGITGKWGAGKTNVMRRAFVTLGGRPIRQVRVLAEAGEEGNSEQWQHWAWSAEDEKTRKERRRELDWPEEYFQCPEGVFCVWFSPWQHQKEENPLIPLIWEIRAQFEAQLENRLDWWRRLPGKTKKTREKLREQCRSNGLAAIKLLEQVGGAASSLLHGRLHAAFHEAGDAARQDEREEEHKGANPITPSDGQRFYLLFEDAVGRILTTLFEFPGQSEKRNGSKTPPPPSEGPSPASARLILFIDDLDRCEEAVIVRLLESIKLYLASHRCVFVLGLDDEAVLDALARHWPGRSEDSNREYLEKLFQALVSVPLPAPARVREAITGQLALHKIPHEAVLVSDMEQLLEPNPRKIKNFINSFCATWNLHVRDPESWAGDETETRRFLLFHYLRRYHRPVWRLLERQPWSLAILAAAIRGADLTEPLPLPENVHIEQQRLLWEFYSRAFGHVLVHAGDEEGKEGIARGNESLDDAVRHFQERQDHKRSDEYLCELFRALIPVDYKLDARHLYLEPSP
ncbi:MAG: KAP family P-loop domain-containing protein [Candidatus Kentron sp. G]|nr:MAG: KAP family P-loop domain-containing protein [Candidatus Kentron sp. G]VFN00627.1 MAG: KAP family P-loop domain-containing protein [Candidatus Kentron sp. G]VFN02497.1 MAG: KAP family P-loop domain-containing protein [Candidatus Kentron sp. G]